MKSITDGDYKYAIRVCKDFVIKNFDNYFKIYVQSNTTLITNVSESFPKQMDWNKQIYLLPPSRCPWQETVEKAKSKLELLNDIKLLLMVPKRY